DLTGRTRNELVDEGLVLAETLEVEHFCIADRVSGLCADRAHAVDRVAGDEGFAAHELARFDLGEHFVPAATRGSGDERLQPAAPAGEPTVAEAIEADAVDLEPSRAAAGD